MTWVAVWGPTPGICWSPATPAAPAWPTVRYPAASMAPSRSLPCVVSLSRDQGKLGQLPVRDVVSRRLVRGPGRAAPGRRCGGYFGKAGPEVPGLGHEGTGSRVILILRRMPGFDDLSRCHAGTSPRSKYDLQGRLTLIASKGRSPISRNARECTGRPGIRPREPRRERGCADRACSADADLAPGDGERLRASRAPLHLEEQQGTVGCLALDVVALVVGLASRPGSMPERARWPHGVERGSLDRGGARVPAPRRPRRTRLAGKKSPAGTTRAARRPPAAATSCRWASSASRRCPEAPLQLVGPLARVRRVHPTAGKPFRRSRSLSWFAR